MSEHSVAVSTPGRFGPVLFSVSLFAFLLVVGWFFLLTRELTVWLFGILVALLATGGYLVAWGVARRSPMTEEQNTKRIEGNGSGVRMDPSLFVAAAWVVVFTASAFGIYDVVWTGAVHDVVLVWGIVLEDYIALVLLTTAWVVMDAGVRGMPKIAWGLVTLFLFVLGLMGYLIAREIRGASVTAR